MWFGTEQNMRWIETPDTGADSSPHGWSTDATMINGGGFALNSWASHKRYSYGWGDTASRELASVIHGFANGTYGRGLIYFLDPMFYETNLLPRHWADPSMALGDEAPPLLYDHEPTGSPVASGPNNLPTIATTYEPSAIGFIKSDSLFIPIPEGHLLYLGAIYTATGSGGVFASPQVSSGGVGVAARLEQLPPNGPSVVQAVPFSGVAGVRVWVGKTGSDASTVTLRALTARIVNPQSPVGSIEAGPWFSGEGHSGCRFLGKPTLVNYTGVDGGQVGLGATLVETGAWE